MIQHVQPYVTPISRSDDPSYGWSWGTGNYVRRWGGTGAYLLTNEHVGKRAATEILAHLPKPGDNYEALTSHFNAWPWPHDVALTRIDPSRLADSRKLISAEQFDSSYSPVKGELLFWLGYPGTTAKRYELVTETNTRYSWAGELSAPGVPMLTQEFIGNLVTPPDGYREEYHALVHYPERAKAVLGGPEVDVWSPHGMSGSLLWDTKRVASAQSGREWSPEQARVCGLLWATWANPAVVVVTRIEHVRRCLVEVEIDAPTS